ncbi:MAG: DNA polymerase IV [Actinobacteria bacterium]|jgi:DNA polymerase IV|nr:DNA polymerase IV [Actinomycetota bacterium]NDD78827.1 DNA polymerase IV [Actinomycetota bacterium]NDF56706.1 DNA polymerase IV [Actinomycetota bacterium]NDG24950.1 DNA polymerase IV [Actinomycetota bacterium]
MNQILPTILHVDMDAFFASVAEKDDPKLKGKAVVVGAGARGVVSAANYEARKFGIRAAMPIYRAKALAPHAVFVTPDHKRYSEVSAQVMAIFEDVTPYVEPISLDEAFLDVTGAKKLLGSGREIADLIRKRVESEQGITCSVGISHNKFIAKIASAHCKPNGVLEIDPDKVLDFLHPLAASEIWGVGPKTNEQLAKLGLVTVGDIANTPRGTLIRTLGQASGSSLYELAWGRDYRDVITEQSEKSISASETFDTDLDDQESILKEILRLTEKSSERMRAKGYAANTISIKVRFADFSTITRSKTLDLPITTTQEIFEVAKNLYLALKLNNAFIRLVGISLDSLVANEGIQQMALGQRSTGWRQADKAVDLIKAKFGRSSLRPARLVESAEDNEDD